MAVNYNLNADRGTDFVLHLQYIDNDDVPVDISGMTAEMQVRRHRSSGTTLISWISSPTGDWDSSYATLYDSVPGFIGATTGSGGIKLTSSYTGGTAGNTLGVTGGIWVIADPTTTANLPVGQHFYDLELYSSNTTVKLLEGRFEVKGNVTR